jgi:hypothetical protein
VIGAGRPAVGETFLVAVTSSDLGAAPIQVSYPAPGGLTRAKAEHALGPEGGGSAFPAHPPALRSHADTDPARARRSHATEGPASGECSQAPAGAGACSMVVLGPLTRRRQGRARRPTDGGRHGSGRRAFPRAARLGGLALDSARPTRGPGGGWPNGARAAPAGPATGGTHEGGESGSRPCRRRWRRSS